TYWRSRRKRVDAIRPAARLGTRPERTRSVRHGSPSRRRWLPGPWGRLTVSRPVLTLWPMGRRSWTVSGTRLWGPIPGRTLCTLLPVRVRPAAVVTGGASLRSLTPLLLGFLHHPKRWVCVVGALSFHASESASSCLAMWWIRLVSRVA